MLSSLKSGLKVPLKGNHLLRGSNSFRHASGGSSSSGELSYFERKQARKDERIRLYQAKIDRAMALKDRRSNAPKDVLKVEFQEWWQAKIAREQKLNRQARQEGKDWKIEVAVVLERLPQILPDKEDYEKEFDELQAHLAQFGKDYPKEFSASLPKDGSAPVSDEDLLALLPEGFKPAPRETKADNEGNTDTLDRKLKDSVFFVVEQQFPRTLLKDVDSESLLEAAKRAVGENGGSQLELYCPSNAPMAVHLVKEEDGSPHFGTKIFFMRLQYDDGDIQAKDLKKKKFEWLDRSEIVDLSSGSDLGDIPDARFYRYLL